MIAEVCETVKFVVRIMTYLKIKRRGRWIYDLQYIADWPDLLAVHDDNRYERTLYKGQASFDYGFPHFTSDSKWRWLQLVLFTITRAEQLVSTKCTTLLFQCHRIASRTTA